MIARSPVKSTKPLSGMPAKRAPTPLRSTPAAAATTSILTSSTATGSTATPHETMVASQLAHINDLVQKNRSLEQMIKKLDEDLSKSTADIVALNTERKSWDGDRKTWIGERQKWMDERKTWAEGCDTMQACHRIQQYRVACALHDERVTVLKVQEVARMERLKGLQRDYKITMFQAREVELEAQVDQVEELRDEAMEVRDYHEKSTQELKARSAALAEEVKSKMEEIQTAHRLHKKVEEDLRHVREAHVDATATSTTLSSKLARLTTERDALETQVTSLKRSLELAQNETTQFGVQLANLQNLKKGEDADADAARKRNTELEQALKEARRRVGELETDVKETAVLREKLEKQKGRVEKLKNVLEEWKADNEEQTKARETAETRLVDAQTQITTLEQRVVELQSQSFAPSKPKLLSKKAPPPPEPAQSDEELGAGPSSSTSALPIKLKEEKSSKLASTSKPSSSRPTNLPAQSRPKPRPVTRPDPIPELQDSDLEILDTPPVPSGMPERSKKVKGKHKARHADGSESGIETGEAQKHKKRQTKDAEAETETEKKERTKTKTKSKKIPSSDDADGRSETKTKVNSKKRTSPDPPKKSKAKSSQLRERSQDAEPAETDGAPKKKKRKINLFGGSQPATFDWNSLGQNGEELGIPTQLSPMKETGAVPRRLGRASQG